MYFDERTTSSSRDCNASYWLPYRSAHVWALEVLRLSKSGTGYDRPDPKHTTLPSDKLMRLLLTTIILTMLSQPAWASDAEWAGKYSWPITEETCENFYSNFRFSLKQMEWAYESLLNGKITREAWVEVSSLHIELAADWASIYTAACKD